MSFKRNELITASEAARYVYCKRAWWYDRNIRIRRRKQRLFGIIPRPTLDLRLWIMAITWGLAITILLVGFV